MLETLREWINEQKQFYTNQFKNPISPEWQRQCNGNLEAYNNVLTKLDELETAHGICSCGDHLTVFDRTGECWICASLKEGS